MKPNEYELSNSIEVTLTAYSGTCIGSFTMESDTPISETAEKLRLGVLTPMLLLSSMMYSNFLKYESETNGERWYAQLTGTPLNDYRYILSLSQLLTISSHYEILVKRLESLRRKLTPTGDSVLLITSQELQQVDFLLASMTLEVVEISKTLRNASAVSSSPTRE